MTMNDPIADMLTRIRNAVSNRAKRVDCLNSKVNRGIAGVLRDEGYINSFDVIDDGRQGIIRVTLKYGERGETVINRIKRESRPGCRVYRGKSALPRPLQGLGISIVSTSSGVLSDRQCREKNVGGELLCTVD
ncbi:MAG: 30S ribosomal protein S8 [Phycisphaeraceae bacterium]|nr:30S ribosomal protein S8 [Phycisphaerales bacterium]MCB9860288.1 30S ribosomal protein S8 [Phycisphaeraceae bacterium]